MSNFQPLEVVGRVSETQLQVVENLPASIPRFEGQHLSLEAGIDNMSPSIKKIKSTLCFIANKYVPDMKLGT